MDQIGPPPRPDGVGKRLGLHTQGWLPYRLHWQLHVVEHDAPARLAFEATGDFVGKGAWTLYDRGDSTRVEYEWTIRADKPLIRLFSLLLKPVFALNHRWAMARGLESLLIEVERRHGRAVRPPPRPVSAAWSGFVILAALAACAAVGLTRGNHTTPSVFLSCSPWRPRTVSLFRWIRQVDRGLMHRTTTWQSARLARARFR